MACPHARSRADRPAPSCTGSGRLPATGQSVPPNNCHIDGLASIARSPVGRGSSHNPESWRFACAVSVQVVAPRHGFADRWVRCWRSPSSGKADRASCRPAGPRPNRSSTGWATARNQSTLPTAPDHWRPRLSVCHPGRLQPRRSARGQPLRCGVAQAQRPQHWSPSCRRRHARTAWTLRCCTQSSVSSQATTCAPYRREAHAG